MIKNKICWRLFTLEIISELFLKLIVGAMLFSAALTLRLHLHNYRFQSTKNCLHQIEIVIAIIITPRAVIVFER
jgi:hypothetical protein